MVISDLALTLFKSRSLDDHNLALIAVGYKETEESFKELQNLLEPHGFGVMIAPKQRPDRYSLEKIVVYELW